MVLLVDTFGTISMYASNGEWLRSFKTTIRNNDHNPQFNEISVFQVHPNDLHNIFFKVAIYQVLDDRTNFEIGKFFVGHNKDSENSHWAQMIRIVRRQVIIWHSMEN